ncbi:MAG: AsmA-like C-terminal domain-containing protein [Sphingomonadales bacterium]
MTLIKRIIIAIILGTFLASIALGLFLWRIQNTPTSITIFEKLIETRISDALPNADLSFESLEIFWDRADGDVELHLTNVSVVGNSGDIDEATISDLLLHLSSKAFVEGDIAVLSANADGIQIDLFAPDAVLTETIFDYGRLRNEAVTAIKQAFQSTAFAQLSRFDLTNLKLNRTDIAASIAFDLVMFERMEQGSELHLSGAIISPTGQVALTTALFVPRAADTAKFETQIQSSHIAPLIADLIGDEWRDVFDGPFNATSILTFGQNATDDKLEIKAAFGSGNFIYPEIYEGPRRLERLDLSASYSPVSEILDVEKLRLEFDTVVLALTGALNGPFDRPAIQLEGRLDGLDANSLKYYWPIGVAEGGLTWIKDNIEQGRLPNGRLNFGVTPAMWGGTLPSDALQFSFDIEDLTAHYNRPMPPLTRAYGQGLLTLDQLVLTINEGLLAGLSISESEIIIAPFSQGPQIADVDLKFNGPITNVLLVLDSEPLGYISEFGLDPKTISGKADAQLLLSIPLLKDLKIEEVQFDGSVEGNDIALAKILGENNLENGRANFKVDSNGLRTVGIIEYQTIEAAIDWYEDFTGNVEHPTKAKVEFTLDDKQLKDLGIDAGSRFKGEVFTTIEIEGQGAEVARGTWTSDLRQATLYEPVLNWRKPLGVEASFTSALHVMNGKASLIDAQLMGAGLNAQFDFSVNDQGMVLSANTIKYGANDFSFVAQREGDRWALDMSGASLDIGPVLKTLYEAGEEEDESEQTTTPWPDIRSHVNLDRLVMANETYLEKAQASLTVAEDHITQLSLSGLLNGTADFNLGLNEAGENTRQLTLTSTDAGLAAKGLDLFTEGRGGKLNVDAEIRGRQDEIEIDGLGEMQDFRLTKAPVLARILSIASLTGIADLARDGRINFRNAKVPFTLRDGIFNIDEASANGPAIGLTMNGQFVQSLKQANLSGVIVPAYGFNSILNKVPLIGNILTGGKNQGIIAINYGITGPLTDPELSVNPASMLAPGILRRIFSSGKPKVVVPELDEGEPSATPSQ